MSGKTRSFHSSKNGKTRFTEIKIAANRRDWCLVYFVRLLGTCVTSVWPLATRKLYQMISSVRFGAAIRQEMFENNIAYCPVSLAAASEKVDFIVIGLVSQ